jgi:hypothetical protein
MSSHASAPVTTSLLTILCVALVHRERPDWLSSGKYDSTTSYIPGSNFEIVSASCRYGAGDGSRRIAS